MKGIIFTTAGQAVIILWRSSAVQVLRGMCVFLQSFDTGQCMYVCMCTGIIHGNHKNDRNP